MARPKLHDDALRTRLLDRAAELLSREGQEALSLRRLAKDVQTSTTAVYSLFGGKSALLQAVYGEAFRRFGEHLSTVEPSDDPMRDLQRLSEAYRRSATADPFMYAVLFGRRAPGFEPDPETAPELVQRADATFAPLVDAVRRGIAAGQLPDEDPVRLAVACWATAHGMVSLEIGGFLPPEAGDAAGLFATAVRAVARGWDPEAAARTCRARPS
jgi:AcrR family transcriptional regulator